MKVTLLPDVQRRPRKIAIGTSDGVHLGHREVIAANDTVVTFDPHPLPVVAPGREPQLLTTLERKAELMAEMGVAELIVVPFDHAWSLHSARSFVDEVLVGALGDSHVSVGENFRFRHDAGGDAREAEHRLVGSEIRPRMRLEGQDRRRSARLGGGCAHRGHQFAMPAMDAVEIADPGDGAAQGCRHRLVLAADREGPRSRLVA